MATFLAIIPARGGSKGITKKNIRIAGGKPLLCHSIESALESAHVNDIVISTDSSEIAQVARQYERVRVVERPGHLALDTTPTEPVLLHVLDRIAEEGGALPDYVILLQPTSPYRKKGAIDSCIRKVLEYDADSLVSVCENHAFFWRMNDGAPVPLYDINNRPRRQDIKAADRWYRENGSIYVTRTAVLRSAGNRLGGRIVMQVMSEEESTEIDSLIELQVLDLILTREGKAASTNANRT
jgi:N-acylneuraminate cytidylyltransferase